MLSKFSITIISLNSYNLSNKKYYNTIPTKYSIIKIIPITKTIEPTIYINRAGNEGRIRFKNIKIIPIIINAIPVSNETILFYYD